MSDGPSDTAPVDFAHPPVVEVALTVQFAGQMMDEPTALNGFWPRVRDRYPNLVMQPALPPMREDFGPTPGVSFQLIGPGAASRYWLVSADQAEVVQVQGDRVAFNWRKEPVPGVLAGEYPRYPYVRERFAEVLAEFRAEAERHGPSLPPNWCEVAYINQIPASTPDGPRPLASILRLVNDVPLSGLPGPEDSALVQRYILARDGQSFGRLHINANAAFKLPNLDLIYVMGLTVRGLTPGPHEEDIMSFMDNGRDLIVHTFRDLTTDEIHAEWGLM